MNERIEYLLKKANSLPDEPGVYLMKDSKEKIIYIGKAKILKNRVTSYFRKNSSHTDKVRKMVENVHDFDFITASSEFEALILENSLTGQPIVPVSGKGHWKTPVSFPAKSSLS